MDTNLRNSIVVAATHIFDGGASNPTERMAAAQVIVQAETNKHLGEIAEQLNDLRSVIQESIETQLRVLERMAEAMEPPAPAKPEDPIV